MNVQVQFRSLTDIWAVHKTWVNALSIFSRRRVLRGVGPYRPPKKSAPPTATATAGPKSPLSRSDKVGLSRVKLYHHHQKVGVGDLT
jgi:hypothetical protein